MEEDGVVYIGCIDCEIGLKERLFTQVFSVRTIDLGLSLCTEANHNNGNGKDSTSDDNGKKMV